MKKLTSLLIPLLLLTSCTTASTGAIMMKVPLNDSRTVVALPSEIQSSILDLTEEITPAYFDAAEKSNQIFSPVSLWYALGVLREGAAGETLDELNRLMKLQPDFSSSEVIPDLSKALNFMEESKLPKINDKGGIRLSNGLFIDESHRQAILEDYLERAATIWGTETATVDFTKAAEARETIRKWVSDKTDDFISDYEATFREDGSAVLNIYNVLYLQDHWLIPFNKLEDSIFHTNDGDVTVPFMGVLRAPDAFVETDAYKAAGFNGEKGIRVWYLLPTASEPEDLIPEIRTILTTEPSSPPPMLNFKAPLLDVEGENLAMKPLLLEKGYTGMFEQANLERMLSGLDVTVDDIRQKTRLQVDEKGFKAAAITEIGIAETASPASVDFFVDKPFLLVIEYEGFPLFISHIANPNEK